MQHSSRPFISVADQYLPTAGKGTETGHRGRSNPDPRPSFTRDIQAHLSQLLKHSLAPTSYSQYHRAWKLFNEFHTQWKGVTPTLPVNGDTAAMFIAYLSSRSYAPSTVRSYISALGHINQLKRGAGFSDNIICKKLLDGLDKSNPARKPRDPITLDILHKLIDSTSFILHDTYTICLYKALFSSMFYMCTRVGEVANSHGNCNNILQLSDISLRTPPKSSPYFVVSFSKFKHNKTSRVHSIPVKPSNPPYCPVTLLQNYLRMRGQSPGPLFRLKTGQPLHSTQLSHTLHKSLRWAGLDHSTFGTHSFRIGRCSQLAKDGASEPYIKFMGRWHSDAFLGYVRPSVFGT